MMGTVDDRNRINLKVSQPLQCFFETIDAPAESVVPEHALLVQKQFACVAHVDVHGVILAEMSGLVLACAALITPVNMLSFRVLIGHFDRHLFYKSELSRSHGMKPVVGLLIAALLVIHSASAVTPEAVYGKNGMIASRSTLASEVGIEIMKQGGNAVDGAVATAFALAVTYPSAGNVGGGGFVVLRLADGQVLTQDHRERAPLAATRDMYLDEEGNVIKGLSRDTLLAAGVPGSVAGLLDLLERYGTLPRKTVMAPAIKLAEEGFVLDYYLARHINRGRERMTEHPASMAMFSVDGREMREGDLWKQPHLAKTLKLISEKGRDGFYKGETADLIVAEMQRGGGIISHDDLVQYEPVWRDAIKATYRGYEVYSMPPPSSGAVLITQMLNMLEPFDVGELQYGSAAYHHLMIEVERRAYADRSIYLGDPDFHDLPIKQLTDKAYAKQRMADFDPDKASDSDVIGPGALPLPESMDTTHFSVMDGDGMMVAFTTTLNSMYGNKIVVPGTGILLNNEMDDFSAKPNEMNQWSLLGDEINAIAPGKRMLSSMSPTIVTKGGEPVLITGSSGGSTILTAVLHIIVNIIDHEMSAWDAVGQPRVHHQWKPDRIVHEQFSLSPDTLTALKAKGHKAFAQYNFRYGVGDANTIRAEEGLLQGVKDPRSHGVAVGF